MKKLLVIVFVCFLLVGCSFGKNETETNSTSNQTKKDVKIEDVLTCSLYTENTVNFTTEMSFQFKDDKPYELGVKYTYDLSPYTEEQRQAFATSKMCEMESMSTTLGIRDCHESLEGTNYIVYGYADKLLAQARGTLKQLQASYVKQGWTCVTE